MTRLRSFTAIAESPVTKSMKPRRVCEHGVSPGCTLHVIITTERRVGGLSAGFSEGDGGASPWAGPPASVSSLALSPSLRLTLTSSPIVRTSHRLFCSVRQSSSRLTYGSFLRSSASRRCCCMVYPNG